jgi:hypothetical protein
VISESEKFPCCCCCPPLPADFIFLTSVLKIYWKDIFILLAGTPTTAGFIGKTFLYYWRGRQQQQEELLFF